MEDEASDQLSIARNPDRRKLVEAAGDTERNAACDECGYSCVIAIDESHDLGSCWQIETFLTSAQIPNFPTPTIGWTETVDRFTLCGL